MKTNFDISLPSIPGNVIKFKIQDIKSAAFGSQKARFADQKSILTQKFIDSFHNFHPLAKQEDDIETEQDSEMQKQPIEKKSLHFRTMVADHKKYLLPIFNDIKKKQKEGSKISKDESIHKGYSFNKSQRNKSSLEEYDEEEMQIENLTENYYFTPPQKTETTEETKEKKEKPSAVFKNETRLRAWTRIHNSLVPGPGSYIREEKIKKGGKKKRKIGTTVEKVDYKHLKNVITKIVVEEEEPEQQQIPEKAKKNDHMFVNDDRDRFGEQKYPIAPKLNVPGPGAYNINESIEEKAKKVIIVEQQRKLLKEWFNN